MPRKGANISLSSYDDIFETDTSRNEAKQERVQEIPLSELHPFEGHPFKVVDDEEMQKTVESVRDFGVLTPAIARPDPDGGYEIISHLPNLAVPYRAGQVHRNNFQSLLEHCIAKPVYIVEYCESLLYSL